VPVHLFGQCANMEQIIALAKKYDLFVIEDVAQAIGADYTFSDGKKLKAGTIGTIGCTSFFPSKNLGCYGDGGAIFTNDDTLLKVIKEVREHGSESRYYHTRLGINGRLDTLQCAILLAKMERYEWELEQRQRVADRYTDAFSSIKADGFSTPYIEPHNKSVWAQYTLTVKDRSGFQKKMTDAGVPTSVHYPRAIPDQPYYKETTANPNQELSISRWAAEHVISLPMFPDMDDSTQDKIIAAVKGAF